ncbi:MAG: BamA/TamA family outer membrane protein [bacterium]
MIKLTCNCNSLRILPFLILFWVAAASTQSIQKLADSSSVINPKNILVVIVQGNEKTKEEIILREMKLNAGDKFDPVVAEDDRLRIQNLGIFNRVEMDAIPTRKGVILVVTVSEMWYLFPYPILFRNERDWSRISYGAGLLHTNFRGRREIIDFSFWLGFNPSVRLSYTNPWIFGNLKFYTRFSIYAKKVRNLSFTANNQDVDENHIGIYWKIGKRFGYFTFLDLNFGYRELTLSSNENAKTLSPSGKDKLPSIGISITYDRRNLWEYAHRGHYINLWFKKTGWFGNVIDYLRYGADLRKYFPIGPTTFAFRGATNLSHGTIPIYSEVHLGFLTRIRGHFSERSTGDNLVLGSAEFRFPIRKITYHNLGLFESMGRYGTNFRFGISGALFLDTGAVWFQNEKLTQNKFISGWGVGLHFFLPYMNILRVEYGFNEDWDGQIIIDAFVSF